MVDTDDFTMLDSSIPEGLAIRMAGATEEANEAFWTVIVKHFPQVTTGDFGPEETHRMGKDQAYAVFMWLYHNWRTTIALRTGPTPRGSRACGPESWPTWRS